MSGVKPFRFLAEARAVATGRELAETARRAEGIGIDTLVIPDHLIPQLAPIPAMATIAAATERLRVAGFVLNNDLRHPAVLAQDLATLDVLSSGRLDVAIGAGWNRPEYEAIGIPFDPTPVRQARLAEAIAVLKGCFADGPFSFAGEHYTITDYDAHPKPAQQPHPPFLIGGGGRRTLALAGREAQIVGLAPRILPMGAGDPASVTVAATAEKIGWAREAAGDRADQLEFNIYPSMTEHQRHRSRTARGAGALRTAARPERCDGQRGRAAGVAAHLHRLGGWAGGEVHPSSRGAGHQLDHGRRGRRAGAGRGTAGGHLTMGMELGVYTFGEVTPDPRTGQMVSPAQRLHDLIEEIELADQAGLDVFGVGEHHRPDYSVSAPAVVLAAAAERTNRIRLTSAVNVISSDDPVRVFQQFATLDLLSGGRAEIMAGRGSFIESFPLFGYDLRDYDSLFEEKLLSCCSSCARRERITWSGTSPRPRSTTAASTRGRCRIRCRSGSRSAAPRSRPSGPVRSGLPMALAIIGGEPERFAPFARALPPRGGRRRSRSDPATQHQLARLHRSRLAGGRGRCRSHRSRS